MRKSKMVFLSDQCKEIDENTKMGKIGISSRKLEVPRELKSLLMKVKEESEKVGLSSTFRKLRSWHLIPSLRGR